MHNFFAIQLISVFLLFACLAGPCRAEDSASKSIASVDPKATITVRIKDKKPVVFKATDLRKLEQGTITDEIEGKKLTFTGAKLSSLLEACGVVWGTKCSLWLDCYAVVESEDAYRAVFSIPEIDPGLAHKLVILADHCNGEPLRKKEGPFETIEEGAKQKGRWVKQAVSISVKIASEDDEEEQKSEAADKATPGKVAKPGGAATKATEKAPQKMPGRVTLVGMGPGDRDLVTFKAAKALEAADRVYCFEYLKEEVERFIPSEKVKVASSLIMGGGFRTQKPEELPADLRERAERSTAAADKFAKEVRTFLAEGKSVVFADSGDPTMYCPWSWVTSEFAEMKPTVVPGLSSFNAANGALKQSVTSKAGAVIISAGENLGTKNEKGRLNDTLVLFTHRFKLAEALPKLRALYPDDTPIAVVCEASYEGEKVYRGTLGTIEKTVGDGKLPHLYLIYVGDAIGEKQ